MRPRAANSLPAPIAWRSERVRLVDQRALPERLVFLECATVASLCSAIRSLAVRGAPALGAAGAFGVALAAHHTDRPTTVVAAARRIAATRPTAVNLRWGVEQALMAYRSGGARAVLGAARRVVADDIAANEAIGRHAVDLVDDGARVLTHCNAGHLATCGYGTALGVVRGAVAAGKRVSVYAGETRPLLQGARLTAWELERSGIETTVIVDSAAAGLMAAGGIDLVVVGADRIAANGDVANKVGTYGLAVLARHHRIPFVVAAPTSTIDLATPTGADIPVERRPADEIAVVGGRRVVPRGVAVSNPAFDVTPARFVGALVTEVGIATRPWRSTLAAHRRSGFATGRADPTDPPDRT